MKQAKSLLMGALLLALAGFGACAKSAAPSCEAVAERAIDRAEASERYRKLPDKVRDSLDDNRELLAKQAVTMCKQRGWSARMRRCKYGAESQAVAAACEDPLRRPR